MFKGSRSGTGYIDWSKVDRAPAEVIQAIKGNLPFIVSQMPYNEQMELLGNYHMKTSDFDTVIKDIKESLKADGAEVAEITEVRQNLSDLVGVLKKNCPKWFK